MVSRNPYRYQSIAIVDPNPASAYRLKAQVLNEGYRQVDVFLSRDSFRDAVQQGYAPDRILPGDRAVADAAATAVR